MKKLKYTLILILSLSYAQIQAQDIFIGTWEYQQGNEIFRVFLWDRNEPDENWNMQIAGHYEKVQVVNMGLGNGEQFIYCSDKEKFQGNNTGWLPFVISLRGNNESAGGVFIDNTVDANSYNPLKSGFVKMEIITNSGSTIRASWKVERKNYQGMIVSNEAPEFTVPTDIVLTKVE